MEGPEAQVLQSLDSFWFFTNIFSTPRKAQNHIVVLGPAIEGLARASEGDEEHSFVETEELLPAKDSKPISPTIQIKQNWSLAAGIVTPMCLTCGEDEAMEVVESPKSRSTERTGTKRRSKRRSRLCCKRREVLGELDLGPFSAKVERDLYINSPRNRGQNLPPLSINGGVAMKEHLKSWAHAVACTVK